MARLRWVAFGAALATYAGACGFPNFVFNGTSSTTATGTGTGGTGSVSSSSSSSSSASSATSSSTGGSPMCQLLQDVADCGAGNRCTIADDTMGTTHCVAVESPALMPFDACANDAACPAGTWCDYRTKTCAPFCEGSADCGAGNCVTAHNAADKSVPHTSVCTAHCNPVDPSSCGAGAACDFDSQIPDFDCFRSMNAGLGAPCSFGDCAPTLVCGSMCLQWCHPIDQGSDDCGGGLCDHFSNLTPVYNGDTYGYCD